MTKGCEGRDQSGGGTLRSTDPGSNTTLTRSVATGRPAAGARTGPRRPPEEASCDLFSESWTLRTNPSCTPTSSDGPRAAPWTRLMSGMSVNPTASRLRGSRSSASLTHPTSRDCRDRSRSCSGHQTQDRTTNRDIGQSGPAVAPTEVAPAQPDSLLPRTASDDPAGTIDELFRY